MAKKLSDIRREYGNLQLGKEDALVCPFAQFELWINQVCEVDSHDPTAMVLSSVDEQGGADSRVVLLKGLREGAFVFYTNYQSAKASQIDRAPNVSLNFFWPSLIRQVRIRGRAARIKPAESDAYFNSRPKNSQLGALASKQSQPIDSREVLENRMDRLIKQYGKAPVLRPEFWGGYAVKAEKIEFWQGRDNRLHDRLLYTLHNNKWVIERLSP